MRRLVQRRRHQRRELTFDRAQARRTTLDALVELQPLHHQLRIQAPKLRVFRRLTEPFRLPVVRRLAGTIILLLGTLTVVGTLLSDLLLMWLDPRIRLGAR